MSADVADHQAHMSIGRLGDVEEVAAQKRPVTPRVVARRDPDRVVADQRSRCKPAFQAGDLTRLGLGQAKLLAGLVGLTATDRIANRSRQLIAIHMALDQIVLRACLDGAGAGRLLAEPGEDDQRNPRRLRTKTHDGVKSLSVGKLQIQQQTVDVVLELCERLCECTGAGEPGSGKGAFEQILDEQGIAVVVLDQQNAEVIARSGHHLSPRAGQHSRPLPICARACDHCCEKIVAAYARRIPACRLLADNSSYSRRWWR